MLNTTLEGSPLPRSVKLEKITTTNNINDPLERWSGPRRVAEWKSLAERDGEKQNVGGL